MNHIIENINEYKTRSHEYLKNQQICYIPTIEEDQILYSVENYYIDNIFYRVEQKEQICFKLNYIKFKPLSTRDALNYRIGIFSFSDLIDNNIIYPFMLFINGYFIPWKYLKIGLDEDNYYLIFNPENDNKFMQCVTKAAFAQIVSLPNHILYYDKTSRLIEKQIGTKECEIKFNHEKTLFPPHDIENHTSGSTNCNFRFYDWDNIYKDDDTFATIAYNTSEMATLDHEELSISGFDGGLLNKEKLLNANVTIKYRLSDEIDINKAYLRIGNMSNQFGSDLPWSQAKYKIEWTPSYSGALIAFYDPSNLTIKFILPKSTDLALFYIYYLKIDIETRPNEDSDNGILFSFDENGKYTRENSVYTIKNSNNTHHIQYHWWNTNTLFNGEKVTDTTSIKLTDKNIMLFIDGLFSSGKRRPLQKGYKINAGSIYGTGVADSTVEFEQNPNVVFNSSLLSIIGKNTDFSKMNVGLFINYKYTDRADNISSPLLSLQELSYLTKDYNNGNDIEYYDDLNENFSVSMSRKKKYQDNVNESIKTMMKYNSSLFNNTFLKHSNLVIETHDGMWMLDNIDNNGIMEISRFHNKMIDEYMLILVNGVLYEYTDLCTYDENKYLIKVDGINPDDNIELLRFQNVNNYKFNITVYDNDGYLPYSPYVVNETMRLFSTETNLDIFDFPEDGIQHFPVDYKLDTNADGKIKIILDDDFYYGKDLVIAYENQFAHFTTYLNETTTKYTINLGDKFMYCNKYFNYLVFYNGRRLSYAHYRLTLPVRPTTPFHKFDIYLGIPVHEGDRLDVVYTPALIKDIYLSNEIDESGDIILKKSNASAYSLKWVKNINNAEVKNLEYAKFLDSKKCNIFINPNSSASVELLIGGGRLFNEKVHSIEVTLLYSCSSDKLQNIYVGFNGEKQNIETSPGGNYTRLKFYNVDTEVSNVYMTLDVDNISESVESIDIYFAAMEISYDTELDYGISRDLHMVWINGKKIPKSHIKDIDSTHMRIIYDEKSTQDISVTQFIPDIKEISKYYKEFDSVWDDVVSKLSEEELDSLFDINRKNITNTEESVYANSVNIRSIMFELIRERYIMNNRIDHTEDFVYDYQDIDTTAIEMYDAFCNAILPVADSNRSDNLDNVERPWP